MKTIILWLTAAILLSGSAMGSVPQLISYQGQLTSIGGTPLDTTVTITFAIYDSQAGGTHHGTPRRRHDEGDPHRSPCGV